MKTTRFIALTSPEGTWVPRNLVGATVKIKSAAVSSGLFAYDSESIYTITDIGFRISRLGKAFVVVTLDGFPGREFVWKDLEILSVRTNIYQKAICGEFCCSSSLCGFRVGTEDPETLEDGDNLTVERSVEPENDGDQLD